MKKSTLILLLIFTAFTFTAQAQTKKTTTNAKPVKKALVKKTTADSPGSKEKGTQQKKQSGAGSDKSKETKTNTPESNYSTAIGIKFLYGIAFTGKHFFTEKHAAEAIVRYNGLGGLGSDINLTALYEYHSPINGVPGLKWYIGGGAYAGTFSFKDSDFIPESDDTSNVYFGLSGVLGLEYKIKNLPIAISADWQPVYLLKDYYDNTGFGAENGGIGIKYTF